MTLQNAPPGLDYDRDKRFSKVVLVLLVNSWAVNSFCSYFFSVILSQAFCSRMLLQSLFIESGP